MPRRELPPVRGWGRRDLCQGLCPIAAVAGKPQRTWQSGSTGLTKRNFKREAPPSLAAFQPPFLVHFLLGPKALLRFCAPCPVILQQMWQRRRCRRGIPNFGGRGIQQLHRGQHRQWHRFYPTAPRQRTTRTGTGPRVDTGKCGLQAGKMCLQDRRPSQGMCWLAVPWYLQIIKV